MPLYTVLAPRGTEARPDPLRLVFVKEGFCWPALFLPGPWLVFRRMWLVLALYVAVLVLLAVASRNIGGEIPLTIWVLLRLLFALEGNGLRRWTLEGAGYRLIGIASGGRLVEAELRYFHANPEPAAGPAAPTSPLSPLAPFQPAKPVEVVGLFPTPGG
ncbi:MAG TPA: DUF2628 domain-containing protein [Bauldia sp.]|nr:DUF2628 domain-containing protein [Bauldia sp.]